MNVDHESKCLSLATVSILGQPPRVKIPPAGRNDTTCEVNLQTSISRVTCDRLLVI